MSKQVSKWIIAVNLPLFLLLIIFPEMILQIVFGESYVEAYKILRILSVAGFCSSLITLLNNLLSMQGRSKLLMYNLIPMVLLNFVLDVLLVRSIGVEGAAIATMVSFVILNIILAVEVYYFLSFIPLRRTMLRIVLSSLTAALFLVVIKLTVEINVIIFILLSISFTAVYIILMLAIGSLDDYDKHILISLKQKIIPTFRSLTNISAAT